MRASARSWVSLSLVHAFIFRLETTTIAMLCYCWRHRHHHPHAHPYTHVHRKVLLQRDLLRTVSGLWTLSVQEATIRMRKSMGIRSKRVRGWDE